MSLCRVRGQPELGECGQVTTFDGTALTLIDRLGLAFGDTFSPHYSPMAAVLEDRQRYTKGKGKAEPREATETTPLLEAGSSQVSGDEDELHLENSSIPRRRLWKRLILVFFFTFTLCLFVFLALVLLTYSYATRLLYLSPDDVLAKGLVFQGPDKVDVINATDGGLWIRLDARVGVDAGSIINVNTADNEGTPSDLWKSVGRLGIRILGTVSANVATVYVYSDRAFLATVSPQPVHLPITSNPPDDSSWLTPVSVPVFVRPTDNSSDLARFVEDSWRHGAASLRASVPEVAVWGGSPNGKGWRSILTGNFYNVETRLSLPSERFCVFFVCNLNTISQSLLFQVYQSQARIAPCHHSQSLFRSSHSISLQRTRKSS